MLEKAYVLEGEATLTADNPALHGAEPVRIGPGDMVTFPKGWKGRWEVHSFVRKRYAFFDAKGLQVDEIEEEEGEEEGEGTTKPATEQTKARSQAKATSAGKGSKTKSGGAVGGDAVNPAPSKRRKK